MDEVIARWYKLFKGNLLVDEYRNRDQVAECGGVLKITALTHPCVRGISASMHVIASIEDPAVAVKYLVT